MRREWTKIVFLGLFMMMLVSNGWTADTLLGDPDAHVDGNFTVDTDSLYVDSTLNSVGVGTLSPEGKFHVFQGWGQINPSPAADDMIFESDTNCGFSFVTPGGTADAMLHFSRPGSVQDGSIVYRFDGDGGGGRMTLSAGKQEVLHVTGTAGEVGVGTSNPLAKLDVRGNSRIDGNLDVLNGDVAVSGQATVQVLEITGGSDLSEYFDVAPTGTDTDVTPGTVVCIDPERPGKLTVSAGAYDRAVAGVISGAEGIRPGMVMSQKDTITHGMYPVALTGRVYCRVDAAHGEIQPGDLLVTSPTPGHAMRVDDYSKAHGAILGKAMSSHADGKGMVLVLISLH